MMHLLTLKCLLMAYLLTGCVKDYPKPIDPTVPAKKEETPAGDDRVGAPRGKPKFDSPVDVAIVASESMDKARDPRLKLVWMSLDGFQAKALETWVSKLPNPHPRGLKWLLTKARGKSDFRVINPTITAPSHVATITCSPAGVHGILDNSSWTGSGTVSGFGKAYEPENWIARMRRHGLRVGVAFYPSIDWNGDARSADVGIAYDTAGSSTQMIAVSRNASVDVIIPARSAAEKSFTLRLSAGPKGEITGNTPWGAIPQLVVAKPHDFVFKLQFNGSERTAAVSVMLVSVGDKNVVAVSPVQMMPAFGQEFREWIDREKIFFSSLKDYKMQSHVPSYLSAMQHRRDDIIKVNLKLLSRDDLDAVFLYFPDLDSLLHGFYRDAANERHVIEYLTQFDREIGKVMVAVPKTADLVVVGDHGMSAIAYSLNARKILGEDVAARGHITTSGGSMYFYPPAGDLSAPPPADLDLEKIAQKLRKMEFEVTKQKIFAKVLVRGSKEAAAEGLGGEHVPWIMAFANDGIGLKNSVEDRLLLARASWTSIPDSLKGKYSDPVHNGILDRPVPAGQHGHYNGLPQMRTRLVLQGPRLSKVPLSKLQRSLQLVPTVADAEGWPRPKFCQK